MAASRLCCKTALRIGLIFLAFLGSLASIVSAAETKTNTGPEGPVFRIVAANDQPGLNQSVQISIQGEHLTDLYAYEVHLSYDSKLLKYEKAVSSISGFSVEPIVTEGHLTFAHTKTGAVSGINGKLTLCTLTFTAMGRGNTRIALESVKLVDSKVDMVTLATDAQISLGIGMAPIVLKDISGHWAELSIRQAVQLGFVTGYEDETFRPDRQVTRAEFTAMLVQALQLPSSEVGNPPFNDLSQIPAWARKFITVAFEQGIVSGYEDNTFRADRLISRAEMTTVVANALRVEIEPDASPTFADTDEIPAWARPYIAVAAESGLVKGRGGNLFAPNNHATRAEAATLILALRQKLTN